jgi:hypothetical protein
MNYEPALLAGLTVLGLAIGYVIRELLGTRRANSLERKLKDRSLKAENEAQDIILQAKKRAVNHLWTALRSVWLSGRRRSEPSGLASLKKLRI